MNCANRTVEKIGSRCFIDSLYSESSYRGGHFGYPYVMTCGNSLRDIVIRVSTGGRFVKHCSLWNGRSSVIVLQYYYRIWLTDTAVD